MCMSTSVDFTVPFVRGKGRVRFVRKTGRTYTPDATAEAMERIRAAYVKAANGKSAPKGVPVYVEISTYRQLPKSRPKKVESEPDVFKPDADNIAKLVLDALNGVAWVDDTQIVRLLVDKDDRTRDPGLPHEVTGVEIWWYADGDV